VKEGVGWGGGRGADLEVGQLESNEY